MERLGSLSHGAAVQFQEVFQQPRMAMHQK